jgi:hypothetical protein
MSKVSVTGTISKMKTSLPPSGPVPYQLPLGDELVEMNALLEKKISLTFTGKIFDIYDGKPIKKSYGGGYSYKNLISLAQCDTCIVKPELCHYHLGTCREPEWGETHCFIPHIVYLSVTSGVKIGITRHTQVPTRWIDQGAVSAIPLLKVEDRRTSGLIEVEIAKTMADKTHWRNMLKGIYEPVDLEGMREQIYEEYGDLLDDMNAEDLDDPVQEIEYPIIEVPEKFSSFSFDKKEVVEGTLLGIKGQYLIFDTGVINMRKHQGYEITLATDE